MEGFSLRRALISLPCGGELSQWVQDVPRWMAYIQLGLFFNGPRQIKLLYPVHKRIVAVDDIGNCRIWKGTQSSAKRPSRDVIATHLQTRQSACTPAIYPEHKQTTTIRTNTSRSTDRLWRDHAGGCLFVSSGKELRTDRKRDTHQSLTGSSLPRTLRTAALTTFPQP